MLEIGSVLRHEAVFEIAARGGIGVLHYDVTATGVLNENTVSVPETMPLRVRTSEIWSVISWVPLPPVRTVSGSEWTRREAI